jgi:EpsI family protein
VVSSLRFAITALLLTATSLFLRQHGRDEYQPSRQSFASFPMQVGIWEGRDVAITPDVFEVLGPGDFLAREYHDGGINDPSVGLFLAYFPTQRTGDTFHSPKDCLPGAGWSSIESSRVNISLPGQEPSLVNREVIGKGTQRGLVLYWYWVHGRVVASEYDAKFYLIKDSLLLHRSDGSMIRVATELRRHETSALAQQRLVSLLSELVPHVGTYIPR